MQIEEEMEDAYEKLRLAKEAAKLQLANNEVSYTQYIALITAAQKVYNAEVVAINAD